MRGKAPLSETPPERHRITPAYAGKSEITDGGVSIRRDHPRLCGEKSYLLMDTLVFAGSPPPMRGKVLLVLVAVRLDRITPAYAGKRWLFCLGLKLP